MNLSKPLLLRLIRPTRQLQSSIPLISCSRPESLQFRSLQTANLNIKLQQPWNRLHIPPLNVSHLQKRFLETEKPRYPTSVSDTVGEMMERESKEYNNKTIAAPILFSALVVVVSFVVAASLREEKEYQQSKKLLQSLTTKMSDVWAVWTGGRQTVDLASMGDPISRTAGGWKVGGVFDRYAPFELKRMVTVVRTEWLNYGASRQLVYEIIALNALVFLAWQVRPLQPFMIRHFMHHPHSGRLHTLVTSAFSHQNVFHFGFNMMALASFGPAVVYNDLGSREHWLAFYISAAVLSGLGSHLYTILGARAALPSLGASGAIFGLFAGTAYLKPEMGVRVAFLPYRFELGDVLPVLVLLDAVGLVRGWAFFDHAAHLSGAAFGFWYSARQLYSIVSDVSSYRHFVPWCVSSRVISSREVAYQPVSPIPGVVGRRETTAAGGWKKNLLRAEVGVGFDAFNETYISDVTCLPYWKVEAVSSDSTLFKTLNTTWRFTSATPYTSPSTLPLPSNSKAFAPLPRDNTPHDYPACWVDFYIAFEFTSPLYATIAMAFFDDACKKMVKAFEKRAEEKYGEASKLAR
ncbi:hypothetical protein SmJEL517_g02205 [Synchytrium microbalum]|uniref:Peptidase S54 rhomboid domain-containing protein n=1 Tax=Synchytrium microbalum TaxID=1806994 RepID=A0A507C887_9FUNG|nr:uncharacterized protein SmJEL517_g02205 [Synchytrium microbalum]TPX35359.1 hypothetical protein SmJEL517_g02205 [Synchytrium microbalum]